METAMPTSIAQPGSVDGLPKNGNRQSLSTAHPNQIKTSPQASDAQNNFEAPTAKLNS